MFDRFAQAYSVSAREKSRSGQHPVFPAIADLVERFGGCSFNGGLYRIHTPESSEAISHAVDTAFPQFQGKAVCFGFDWMGRQFALNLTDPNMCDPAVLMFEPGTGEVLDIPVAFSAFHDQELVDFPDAALAAGFFDEWALTSSVSPTFSECVGYRVPLFLSGADDVENLEKVNLDVYWTISAQLIQQTQRVALGTSVCDVSIKP